MPPPSGERVRCATGVRSGCSPGGRSGDAPAAHVEFSISLSTASQRAALRRTPGVIAIARLRGYGVFLPKAPNLTMAAQVDDVIGNAVDRPRVIEGRRADLSSPNEIAISESLASQLHLRLGSVVAPDTYTLEQKEIAFSGGQVGPPAGPKVRFRVVGIVRLPYDLGDRATSGGVVIFPPAFDRKYQGKIALFAEGFRVRTTGNADDVAAVIAKVRVLWKNDPLLDVQVLAIDTEGARNAIDVLTRALWILAAVAAVAGFAAIGIVLTRDITNTQLDQSTLMALGFTRRDRVAANMPRAVLVAVGGALLAGVLAVVASPLLPFGVARRADPNPGLHADWTVLAIAVPLAAALVLLVAYLAALRATRSSFHEQVPNPSIRTSSIVGIATGFGLSPTISNGLRMAFEPGKGERAVPVRSAFAGAAAGVAGLTAVIVFAASLNHLVATPKLYGWTWDVQGEIPTVEPCLDHDMHGFAQGSGIEAIATVCTFNIQVDKRPVIAWGFEPVRGVIEPTVVAGRAPSGPREVALGSVTLHSVHKHIGDTVTATGQKGARTYKIVGSVVFPTIGAPQPLADGASFTSVGLVPILDTSGENQTHFAVARAAPGIDRAALERRSAAGAQARNIGGPKVPEEVDHLRQVDWLPSALGALLGALALLAVGASVASCGASSPTVSE